MSAFWSDVTRQLHPYIPGEQPKLSNLIKLNTNEHPLPPSAAVLQAIRAIEPDALRRYPDPDSIALRSAIAGQTGLAIDEVFVGNGSDEVLAHVFQALISSSTVFSAPDITYSFYPVWAQLYRMQLNEIPLLDDFHIDVPAMCAAPGPLLFANPNAPTGIALSIEQLEQLVASDRQRLVVVDEAYFGFGATSAVSLLAGYDNLLVTRSLSKSHGLAGLRLGYALGSKPLIQGLVRVKDSFNSYPIDAIAQAAALAAVEDVSWLQQASTAVSYTREQLSRGLAKLGFEVLPSSANFVFCRHSSVSGKAIFDALRAQGIIIRRWDKPRIDDYLRITVGTDDQSEALLAALDNILST